MGKSKMCKCGHRENVHVSEDLGGCCVIYRGKDGNLKSCQCNKFEEKE